MISRSLLEQYYLQQNKSMQDIATLLGCSLHKVSYYMKKHGIKRRTRSDAAYLKHNPTGDPFSQKTIASQADAVLFGTGIGLYWGEGTKANKYSVRLGNSDPELIKTFMKFLVELFSVCKDDLRFSLQLFSDTDPEEALVFWVARLGVKRSQFYKTTVTISGSIGTYRKKSTYGVATVYYHNKKLRDLLVRMLPR